MSNAPFNLLQTINANVCAIKKHLCGTSCIIVSTAEGAGIGLQRDGGVLVAEAGGDGHGVDVVGQQDGGVGMAEAVELEAFEAVGVGELAEPLGGRDYLLILSQRIF